MALMKPSTSYVLKFLCLAVTVLLLMLAPWPGLAQASVRTLCMPLEIHGGSPDEQACLNQFADVAKRDGGDLTLKLKNGKTKVISDAKDCKDPDKEDACVTYRLKGYIGDRQFIVQVLPYECPFVLLVNRRTGAETTLGGWPELSPNKKRFVVTASFAAGECSPDYGIAIFSLASDPPRLEWHFTPKSDAEDYMVDGWDGENRVLLRTYVDRKQAATDLKLTAQGWQLRQPNGELSLGVPAPPARANSPGSAQPANAVAPVAPPGR
jgi:hypothetical protein